MESLLKEKSNIPSCARPSKKPCSGWRKSCEKEKAPAGKPDAYRSQRKYVTYIVAEMKPKHKGK